MQNSFPIVCKEENHWHLTDENYHNEHMLSFQSEYKKYWQKIERGENFALARYADGELALMLGKKIKAIDGWEAEEGVSLLGKALKGSLGFSKPNFVYGISCPCCDSEAYYWYLDHLKGCNITFSNIWANANFSTFAKDFINLQRNAILITNHRGKGKTYGKLNVVRHYFTTDDDSVRLWKEKGKQLIQQIIDETGNERDMLYVVSAGPMSALFINALYKNNPNNTYVDFGSSIDFITHGKVTRPYMIESTPYAKQKCWMFDNKSMSIDVDVVLSAYRRPEVLEQQIESIKNQTLKPKRILLYQDAVKSGDKVEIDANTLNKFDAYCIAKENGGVWKRFEYAAEVAMSPYVCLFDDDTIPGRRWLENCHMHSVQIGGGCYGTNGIVLKDAKSYPAAIHFGWHGATNETREVDFVGHSWFVQREYLKWLLEKPYGKEFKYVGEDMALSFACQEHGVKTFVPEHPVEILSLWGSLPEYGNKYGGGEVAVSVNPDNLRAMLIALNKMHQDGWKFLFETNPYYVKHFSETGALLHFNEIAIKTNLTLLKLFGKKRPIFIGENKYANAVKNLFALNSEDYTVLEDNTGNVDGKRLLNALRKYSIHIFFTDIYDKLKPFIQQQGWTEYEDFIDGRSLLTFTSQN